MKITNCAERLKQAMLIRNIKQAELCRLTDIPKSAMSQYVSGIIEPKRERVNILAEALNVSAAWLMGYEVAMSLNAPQREYFGDSLEVIKENTRMIPVFESVAAGFGCYANDQIIDYIPLAINSKSEADCTICIRVSGDSMYPKIEDGDLIVVEKCDSVDSGSIGVFLIDNENGVVKKVNYVYGQDWVELISLNPEYMPRRFEGVDVERVKTLGLVKKVIKNI